jgi:hypothetical protein
MKLKVCIPEAFLGIIKGIRNEETWTGADVFYRNLPLPSSSPKKGKKQEI